MIEKCRMVQKNSDLHEEESHNPKVISNYSKTDQKFKLIEHILKKKKKF